MFLNVSRVPINTLKVTVYFLTDFLRPIWEEVKSLWVSLFRLYPISVPLPWAVYSSPEIFLFLNCTSLALSQFILRCVCYSLITTMVTLMWASLDMVTLDSLQVFKDQSLIQIWTASMFTLYHAASLIVLLNMLIAMMSNSYQRVEVCKKRSEIREKSILLNLKNFVFSVNIYRNLTMTGDCLENLNLGDQPRRRTRTTFVFLCPR